MSPNQANENDQLVDEQTAALLADSVSRILSDLCTPALLRSAQQAAKASLEVDALWGQLLDAGLVDAMRADDGEGLGWGETRALIEACGYWGLPLPLPETLAAQALCRLAGASLPDGAATIAVARLEDESVIAEGVAHANRADNVMVSIPSQDGQPAQLVCLPVARARVEPSIGIAEPRDRLIWALEDAQTLGSLPNDIDTLLVGAALRSAQIAGACARVLEISTTYASDRVQFGRAISKFQAIQQQLALAGEWTAMAAMGSQLALAGPGLRLDPVRVASAKQVAGTAVQLCCEIAHAVHGAIGVTAEYDLQLFTRRLWTWSTDFGSSLFWARRLGTGLIDEAPDYSWDCVVRASSD
jgi:acyl-CoA dehydrogenase